VADFDGVVVLGDLSQSLGSPVEKGQVLFEVAPLNSYRELRVDERDIAEVAVGQRGPLLLTRVWQTGVVVALTALLACAILPCVAHAEGELAQLKNEYRQLIARLIEKAAETGTVNVIVGLKLAEAYTPEAQLPDRAAVERQRAAIAQARDALLASLRTARATEYARWDTLPLAALRVDAAALRLLAETSLITTIQEEGLSRPQ
jgi:hypothetical protein